MNDRLKIRLPDADGGILQELVKTAQDRIILRAGIKGSKLPKELESICVEVVTAMYNKHEMQHEGVDSEGVDVFSVKFVNDLLKQYDDEFKTYRDMKDKEEDDKRGVVRFL